MEQEIVLPPVRPVGAKSRKTKLARCALGFIRVTVGVHLLTLSSRTSKHFIGSCLLILQHMVLPQRSAPALNIPSPPKRDGSAPLSALPLF